MNQGAVVKINKIGKAGVIISRIIEVFLGIGILGCLIAFIVLLTVPSDLFHAQASGNLQIQVNGSALGAYFSDENEETIKDTVADAMGNGSVTIDGNGGEYGLTDIQVADDQIAIQMEGNEGEFSVATFRYVMIVAIIPLMMSFITVMFAGFLAKSFATCHSPFDENVIQKMKNFAYSLIPWVFISGITNMINNSLVSGGKIQLNLSMNLSYVFIILIIFALVFIFKYGAELQRESDETL